MSEEKIFNSEEGTPTPSQETAAPAAQPATTPEIPPELSEWVGPGKKYQSVSEVYKAFGHAQNHISSLEEKYSTLEQELNKRKSAEDVLNEIKSSTTAQQKPTSQGVEVNQNVLSEMVRNELTKYTTQQQQQQNFGQVEQAFVSSFKEKADEQFVAMAKENGVSVEEFKQLAMKSPQMVLKLAGINKPSAPQPGRTQGDVNTQALKQQADNQDEYSAKVNTWGATSKDLAKAWAGARNKVLKDLNNKG